MLTAYHLSDVCQPAVSNQIVWVCYAFNVTTDMYLLSIPLPMLWSSRLKTWKKLGLVFLFSGGIFVMVCGTLRAVIIVTVRPLSLITTWGLNSNSSRSIQNSYMLIGLLK